MDVILKKKRDSNIEILRILAMCLIVYHHLVLNMDLIAGNTISKTIIFGVIGEFGGKIGVAIYVLITGYFSVVKKFSSKKFFKLWFQVFCYSVGFMIFFRITGIEKLNKVDTIKTFFPLAYNQYWFITAYLYLLLFSPFINKLLNNLTQINHKKLLIILTIFLVIMPTIFYSDGMIGSTATPIGIILFVYIYCIGAYIKLYGIKMFENKRLINIIFILLGYIAMFLITFLQKKLETKNIFWSNLSAYYRELNSLIIIVPSIALFYIFKEWRLPCNNIINYIASISFPVYLIHENNFVRYRMWHEIFNMELAQRLYGKFITLLIIAIILLYIASAIIEFFRINLIEKILLKSPKLNKMFNKIDSFMSLE